MMAKMMAIGKVVFTAVSPPERSEKRHLRVTQASSLCRI
jgi:hypothetical protein